MPDIPHLKWPFAYERGAKRLGQVDQDSIEDLEQSVHAYMVIPRGSRPLNPDFGMEDPTFGPGIDPAKLAREIEDSEDGRASVSITVTGPNEQGQQQVLVEVENAE
jgi:hypothetical protein